MELLTDKVIYHVETQEDYDDLMEKLDELGCKWFGDILFKTVNFFPDYGENTAIRVVNKETFYSPLSYYLDNINSTYKDHQIIKYKKDKKEQNPMKVKLKADQKFIADWYEKYKEEYKDNFEHSIYIAFNDLTHFNIEEILADEFLSWLDEEENEPVQTLVKMHLFGYELEKEPFYYVAIPNPNSAAEVKDYHLAKTTDGRVEIQKRNTTELKDNWKLTEAEIKKDFAWAWQFAKEV